MRSFFISLVPLHLKAVWYFLRHYGNSYLEHFDDAFRAFLWILNLNFYRLLFRNHLHLIVNYNTVFWVSRSAITWKLYFKNNFFPNTLLGVQPRTRNTFYVEAMSVTISLKPLIFKRFGIDLILNKNPILQYFLMF